MVACASNGSPLVYLFHSQLGTLEPTSSNSQGAWKRRARQRASGHRQRRSDSRPPSDKQSITPRGQPKRVTSVAEIHRGASERWSWVSLPGVGALAQPPAATAVARAIRCKSRHRAGKSDR